MMQSTSGRGMVVPCLTIMVIVLMVTAILATWTSGVIDRLLCAGVLALGASMGVYCLQHLNWIKPGFSITGFWLIACATAIGFGLWYAMTTPTSYSLSTALWRVLSLQLVIGGLVAGLMWIIQMRSLFDPSPAESAARFDDAGERFLREVGINHETIEGLTTYELLSGLKVYLQFIRTRREELEPLDTHELVSSLLDDLERRLVACLRSLEDKQGSATESSRTSETSEHDENPGRPASADLQLHPRPRR